MAYLIIGDTKQRLETECVLGRHRSCNIRIADTKASRQHARLFLLEEEWWVEDLASANGTLVNGEKLVARKRMADGDVIRIGKCEATLVSRRVASDMAESIPDDMVGRQVAGYLIDGLIGRGVTGTIFTATQLALERGVAFKILDPHLVSADPKFADRFVRTINRAASLTHDGLVKIHECGNNEGLLWYTMELVQGDTLDGLLKREGTLEPGLALMMVEKAADALHAAHLAGLAHGDVKPATLMLTETGHVKVLDIGVVGLTAQQTRQVQGESATKQVFYLAPEQARGGAANVGGDIYSLGCVLFHVLSGKVPFAGTNFEAVVKAHESQPIPGLAKRLQLPAELDQVLGQMLAKNPEWRYESMIEVKAALRKLREDITPDAASEEVEKKARAKLATRARDRTVRNRHDSRRQVLTFVLVAGVIVVLCVFGLPYLQGQRNAPAANVTSTTPAVADTSNIPAEVPKDPVAASTSTAGSAVPEKDPLLASWQQASKKIDFQVSHNDWGAAELTLKSFTDSLSDKPNDGTVAELVHLRTSQVLSDGDTWYQHQIEKLASDSDPAGLSQRLRALTSLRDVTLSSNRADAEARYQEALSKLTQRLSLARRRAREVIENGQFQELSELSAPLEAAFADTPVVGLQQTFSSLVQEAAGVRSMWQGDWPKTRVILANSRGAACLPAAAALILGGDADGQAIARKLLLDPGLSTPILLKRKEALLGRGAAILTFKDPSDLQFIDTLQGEPLLNGGSLHGEDTCGIACTAPVGGPNWSASVSMTMSNLPGQDGEAAISCVNGAEAGVVVRIGADAIHCLVRTADVAHGVGIDTDQRFDRGTDDGHLRLRLSCRDDVLQVLLNDKFIGSWSHPTVSVGSKFRCEFGGLKWAITEMQVIGGE